MMRISRTHQLLCAAGLASLCALLGAGNAAAEPTAPERAAAEALYQQGNELMADKRFAPACEKFEGSQQLDPALGTMLRLADCYDRVGRSASAWGLFREGVSLAHSRGETEREKIATERVTELEKRLSKLELRVDRKNGSAGLEIQVNGRSIPRAGWDTPIPIDPGPQRIAASAPDKAGWSATVDVPEGPVVRSVDVPLLLAKPQDARSATATSGSAMQVGESSSQAATLRTVGYVAGGVAIAGLTVGGILSYKAYDSNHQSLSQCRVDDANACTAHGKDLRDAAQQYASSATVVLLGSGALLVGGVVLVLSSRSAEARPPGARELKASATLSGTGAGFRLEGTW